LKITRYNKYNDPIIFEVLNTKAFIYVKRNLVICEPDGNSFYYSTLKIKGFFDIRKNNIITICNKKYIKFKINNMKDNIDNSNNEIICFELSGKKIEYNNELI
jgi:hypothetical protein